MHSTAMYTGNSFCVMVALRFFCLIIFGNGTFGRYGPCTLTCNANSLCGSFSDDRDSLSPSTGWYRHEFGLLSFLINDRVYNDVCSMTFNMFNNLPLQIISSFLVFGFVFGTPIGFPPLSWKIQILFSNALHKLCGNFQSQFLSKCFTYVYLSYPNIRIYKIMFNLW